MSLDMRQSFVRAFSRFPGVEFIWKHTMTDSDRALFEAVSNIHVFDWVDQVSILDKRTHPKTLAFVTHAGLNSVNEASALGVPTICIPLFADHLYNSAIAVKLGTGVHLDVRNITEQSVFEALNELLNNVSYRGKALRIKLKLQSHPFRPQERFIKWVEFAAEFPDLSELNLAGAELNAFVYHSLDVVVPVVLLVVILFYSLYYTVKRVLCLLLVPSRAKFKIP
ncbi:CRE-UGT-62 protein [Aphelenchoides avenae]|nr:CRE-UGT-62 protein [Aphelenchus avenae]